MIINLLAHFQYNNIQAVFRHWYIFVLTYNIFVLTSSVSISQLPADHSSISSAPKIITHCPPLVVDAHFHSTLVLIRTSHQTDITIGTCDICKDCVHRK